MTAERVSLAVLATLVIGGGTAWLIVASRQPVKPVEPTEPTKTVAPPVEPPTAAVIVEPPAPTKPKDEDLFLLPDGSKVAALNGVKNAPRLVWDNPEWSPIVRTEHNNGYDWYVHADGTYTTTLMIWRSDLGRADAMSQALHPRDAVPVRPLPPEDALLPGQLSPGKPAAGKD